VTSAGPYASLHLAPDRQPRQHPTTQFFTGRVPFLPPNQQRQSTEGNWIALGPDYQYPLRQSIHLYMFYTLSVSQRDRTNDSHIQAGYPLTCYPLRKV